MAAASSSYVYKDHCVAKSRLKLATHKLSCTFIWLTLNHIQAFFFAISLLVLGKKENLQTHI